jgi:hypothetical protein
VILAELRCSRRSCAGDLFEGKAEEWTCVSCGSPGVFVAPVPVPSVTVVFTPDVELPVPTRGAGKASGRRPAERVAARSRRRR